jgi:hypothetical protein
MTSRELIRVIIIITVLLLQHLVSSDIVQVIVINRHCDRTPAKNNTIPNNPVNWKKELGVSFGQLTGLGESQCYQMGQSLRQKYIEATSEDHIRGLSQDFDDSLYSFHSSNVGRAIVSMFSIGQGLFPNGTGLINDIDKQYAMPSGLSIIPIHTIPSDQDVLLHAHSNCPLYVCGCVFIH